MPFITQNNFDSIMRRLMTSEIDTMYMDTLGKPWFSNLYNLSRKESKKLLLHKGFHYNPEPLIKHLKSTKEDTFVYLYEAGQSSYHKQAACPYLTAPFYSPKVPGMVRTGNNMKAEVIRFRVWYKENNWLAPECRKLFYTTPPDPSREQQLRKEMAIMHPEHAINSGIKEVRDYTLDELHGMIEYVIEETTKYYQQCSPIEKIALNQYKCNSVIGYLDKPLDDNKTGMGDEELKEFLRDYHETFKEPLFQDLIGYYRVRFNPELEFKGELLEQLNFKPCLSCHKPQPDS